MDVQHRNVSAFRALFSEVVPPEGTPLARMVFDTSNEVGCTDTGGISIHNVKDNYLVVRRGVCKFFEKAVLAQSLGAIGLIVINTVDSHELYVVCCAAMLAQRVLGQQGVALNGWGCRRQHLRV